MHPAVRCEGLNCFTSGSYQGSYHGLVTSLQSFSITGPKHRAAQPRSTGQRQTSQSLQGFTWGIVGGAFLPDSPWCPVGRWSGERWGTLCGWEAASPTAACLSAVRQGHALSAAAASGLSCESSPPPLSKPKGRMVAKSRTMNGSRQRRHSRMPFRNQGSVLV